MPRSFKIKNVYFYGGTVFERFNAELAEMKEWWKTIYMLYLCMLYDIDIYIILHSILCFYKQNYITIIIITVLLLPLFPVLKNRFSQPFVLIIIIFSSKFY